MSRHSFEDAQAAYLAGLDARRKLRSEVSRRRARNYEPARPRHGSGLYRAADIIERERQTRKRAALMARYSGYVGGWRL